MVSIIVGEAVDTKWAAEHGTPEPELLVVKT